MNIEETDTFVLTVFMVTIIIFVVAMFNGCAVKEIDRRVACKCDCNTSSFECTFDIELENRETNLP